MAIPDASQKQKLVNDVTDALRTIPYGEEINVERDIGVILQLIPKISNVVEEILQPGGRNGNIRRC